MNHTRRIPALLATCAAALLLAAACGSAGGSSSGGGSGGESAEQALGGQAAAQEMSTLYQQAQQKGEKQVVVYGADIPYLKTVYDTFSKRYPSIKVQGQLLTGTLGFEGVTAEGSAVHAERTEQADVAPLAQVLADAAGLEHDDGVVQGGGVQGRLQPDRAGAEDGDAGRVGPCHVRSSQR